MTEPENPIQTIEQATKVNDLLTHRGIDAPYSPFIVGPPVMDKKTFFGKRREVEEVMQNLKHNDIAVIEGGNKSGKSSLLTAVAESMREKRMVKSAVLYDLHGDNLPADQILKFIRSDLPRRGKSVIAFDEIETYAEKNPTELSNLLDKVEELRIEGHKIIFAVNGDLRGDSRKELPRIIKDRLLKMSGNVTTINKLLDESEMRELLAQGGEPFFTEPLIRYIMTQSGGHPYLLSALADRSWILLQEKNTLSPNFSKEIASEVTERVLFQFGSVVETILAAGFDPLTWQWNGEGKKPNVEIYQNMLPRYTSTIFKEWLTEHIRKR